jgi:hypothetical protein
MITVKFDQKQFQKDMNNLTEYAVGFFEGVQRGKVELLKEVGERAREILYEYIDSVARVNPSSLHHVYEWYQTGSPEARLFDLQYSAAAGSLSMNATFTQSRSIKNGSTTPFYNKAAIMERGISVVIRPRAAKALRFVDEGQEVFTKGPVLVTNPGGQAVAGSFDRTFSEFFERYFTQSFMEVSGLAARIRNTSAFVRNFNRGKTGGRQLGNEVGYRWAAGKEGM